MKSIRYNSIIVTIASMLFASEVLFRLREDFGLLEGFYLLNISVIYFRATSAFLLLFVGALGVLAQIKSKRRIKNKYFSLAIGAAFSLMSFGPPLFLVANLDIDELRSVLGSDIGEIDQLYEFHRQLLINFTMIFSILFILFILCVSFRLYNRVEFHNT